MDMLINPLTIVSSPDTSAGAGFSLAASGEEFWLTLRDMMMVHPTAAIRLDEQKSRQLAQQQEEMVGEEREEWRRYYEDLLQQQQYYANGRRRSIELSPLQAQLLGIAAK